MRALKTKLTLAAFLVIAAADSQAQTVYSVRVYAGGRSWGPDWTIGSGSARFGLWVYGVTEDAAGNRLNRFAAAEKGIAWQEQDYTVIQVGPYSREVRAPIGVVAGAGLVGLLSLIVAACAGRTIMRRAVAPTPLP